MTSPAVRDQFLTVDEVADWLRVDPKTLYDWRARGLSGQTDPGPTSMKFGARVVYPESEVQAYIDRQKAETSSKAS